MRPLSLGYVLTMALALAACDREATGQVAAVVNGEEITLQEVNAELGNSDIAANADTDAVRSAALQRIVERRLLAQAAREDNIDREAEFLIRRRQLEDGLLVQMLSQRLARSTDVPDQREIDAFIEDNPEVFANRTVYEIDRIQFPVPADPSTLQALEDDHSMSEVVQSLDRMGIDYTREPAQMDSARLGTERMNRILSLPDGEPFILPDGNLITVGVISGQRQVPISGPDARPLAVRALRNQALSQALRQRLEREKAEAEIEYKEGLAPEPSSETASENSAIES